MREGESYVITLTCATSPEQPHLSNLTRVNSLVQPHRSNFTLTTPQEGEGEFEDQSALHALILRCKGTEGTMTVFGCDEVPRIVVDAHARLFATATTHTHR